MHGPTMDMKVFSAPRRIRVLQMVGNGIVGGMESVVLRLVERLPSDRFEVFALCPYEGAFTARLRALGVDCMAVPMPDDPPWSVVQSVVAFVRSAGIDVLHAHLTNAHLLAAIAGSIAGRPVLTTLHGRQLNMSDLEAHRALRTHLCTVCRHSELHALSAGAKRSRVSFIPNGVDTTVFTPALPLPAGVAAAANDGVLVDAQARVGSLHMGHQAGAATGLEISPESSPGVSPGISPGISSELSLEVSPEVSPDISAEIGSESGSDSGPDSGCNSVPDISPVIGFVGRLSPEKGPDIFVHAALLLLHSRLPNARFVLIGDGPMRDEVLALLAAGQAHTEGAPGIHWQGLRDDMPAAYRELDMLVSTSHSEAMPLAIMEAMASGLPVVATRVGGVPDLVVHGSTGWLTWPGDVHGIADLIERLARDPAEAQRMGAQGRARMVAGFDLAQSVGATVQLLERLATRPLSKKRVPKERAAAAQMANQPTNNQLTNNQPTSTQRPSTQRTGTQRASPQPASTPRASPPTAGTQRPHHDNSVPDSVSKPGINKPGASKPVMAPLARTNGV